MDFNPFVNKPDDRLLRLEREHQERVKLLMLEQLRAAKLKYAKQQKFEFAKPGEDWGSNG